MNSDMLFDPTGEWPEQYLAAIENDPLNFMSPDAYAAEQAYQSAVDIAKQLIASDALTQYQPTDSDPIIKLAFSFIQ